MNKTNNMARFANHSIKHCHLLIKVCMFCHHLAGLLPVVDFLAAEGIFCHMVCLLPRVGFLSADVIPTAEGASTSNGFSDIDGFFTINGFSTIDGLPTTKGVFCR